MNIIDSTRHNLTDAFKHYVCMRLRFRSSVLRDTPETIESLSRYESYCPAKRCEC